MVPENRDFPKEVRPGGREVSNKELRRSALTEDGLPKNPASSKSPNSTNCEP